ncbi:MAG TPA: hypothetical protein PLV06_06545 [Bacteroidales bacterium]|nr:hypothetical protein [Bacteroidales bacterium]HPJ58973.1 hypothetical protein [Bacteroidales bacterium]HPR12025.1 hypothetical protein [Bacteroidales bacterium]HRW86282.1 hypothetical protein [Bacteroidales bacterium]
MKSSSCVKPRFFKGAGYLFGGIIGITGALTVFVLTESINIALPVLAALSIPLGVSIESKIQKESGEIESKTMKTAVILITAGVFFFVTVVLLAMYS